MSAVRNIWPDLTASVITIINAEDHGRTIDDLDMRRAIHCVGRSYGMRTSPAGAGDGATAITPSGPRSYCSRLAEERCRMVKIARAMAIHPSKPKVGWFRLAEKGDTGAGCRPLLKALRKVSKAPS